MARYYFHLRDGVDVLLDPDGRELETTEAIHRAAMVEARSIISNDAIQGYIKLAMRLDIEDDAGAVVHSLEFEDAVEIEHAPAKG